MLRFLIPCRNRGRSALEVRMDEHTTSSVNQRMTCAKINVWWSLTTWSTDFWRRMWSRARGACVGLFHRWSTWKFWRRTDIKTYAVTPLNEECGLIEWVDNLQTLREIVIKLLRERGVSPNVCISELPFSLDETSLILPKYNDIKKSLDEACSDVSKLPLFITDVLAK